MISFLMNLFGFERTAAFYYAAPAILIFTVTGAWLVFRTLLVLADQIKHKDISLLELLPLDFVSLPSLATCLILGLCGIILCVFDSCNCSDGQWMRGPEDGECKLVTESWVTNHWYTQHWWQMMSGLLVLAIACCTLYGCYWFITRVIWGHVLKKPFMAIDDYFRSFKFRL